MFEDEEFDLDFSEKCVKSKKETEIEKVDERNVQVSKTLKQGLNGHQKGQVLSTQKSIFSMDDTSDSDSEILDISLNLDGGDDKAKKEALKIQLEKDKAKKIPLEKAKAKKETLNIPLANKSKLESSISSKPGTTQGTQKSIFSLDDSFGDDSEILDISLNCDMKDKEEQVSHGRKSTDSLSVKTNSVSSNETFKVASNVRLENQLVNKIQLDPSRKDPMPRNQNDQSSLRAGSSRKQESKSYNSTGEQKSKSNDSAENSYLRAGPSRDQQSKSYDSSGDSHLRAGSSRDQQSKSYELNGGSHLRAGSSSNQQSRSYDSTGDSANVKTFQGGVKRGIENERLHNHVAEHERKKPPRNNENGNTPKRRFPGPAGLLPILKPGNLALVVDEDEADENTEQAVPDLQCSQENADENIVWIKALDDLGMQWGDPDSLVSKYNVGHIKQNAKPGSSIRMPILVARIKNLDTSCLDPICRLRDPHGEVGGSIHRDVIEQFGPQIQVGSILVLRNVIVLMTSKTQYVNITANNMVSIYRPDNVAHIHTLNLKDMEEAAEQLEKVRQEQLKDIQGASAASAQPAARPQPPAFSVPGQYAPSSSMRAQHAGAPMMPECPSPLRAPGPSSLRTPGPSPLRVPGPFERRQNVNAQNNMRQQISPINSHQGYQQNNSVSNNRFQGQSNYQGQQRNLPNNNNGNQRPIISSNSPRPQLSDTPPNQQLTKTPPNPPGGSSWLQQSHNNSPTSATGSLRSASVTSSFSSNDGFKLPLAPQQSTNKFVFRPKASGPCKPLASSKPLANATNIERMSQTQESCFNSSQVLQKITESFRTPQSQASSLPESQNLIASMMEGLDSDSFFGDF